MNEQMSRDAWERLPSEKERSDFITKGGTLYDGDKPPLVVKPPKPSYPISRKLYNSLTAGQERALIREYQLEIID